MFKFNLKFILAFGIAFTGTAVHFLSETSNRATHKIVINDIIDTNIDKIQEAFLKYDPMSIEDNGFEVNSYIYMRLSNGWLQKLSRLRRDGDCTLDYSDKIVSIDLNFAWDELRFEYHYLVEALLYTREGDLFGELSYLKVNIRVEIDLENYRITLKKLDFVDSGELSIYLKGNAPDFILNLAIKFATTFCKTLMLNVAEQKSVNVIQAEIDVINEQLAGVINHRRLFTFVDLVSAKSDNVI